VAVGAASPIPATAAFLLRLKNPDFRISLLQKRKGNPFSEGSRELFDLAGQGRIDAFFLGGAQIDGEGNVNLVEAEGRRFPGSFGSAFMYGAVRQTILFREEHSRRVLVPKVEFVSAAGNPAALLTGKALFGWNRDRRRFVLRSFHYCGGVDEVRRNTGFDFDIENEGISETTPPGPEEMELLRGPVARQIAVDYPEFAKRVWG
jgi:glutaconate CoA-transferase subunit B